MLRVNWLVSSYAQQKICSGSVINGVRQGLYVFKLLAVDVPSAAGPEQRIYLEGDERIYNRGSVMRELRDPFLNVRSVPLGATTELLPSHPPI